MQSSMRRPRFVSDDSPGAFAVSSGFVPAVLPGGPRRVRSGLARRKAWGGVRRVTTLFCRQMVAVISAPLAGVAYCRAAQRDERAGYRITAAVEWRKAAELMQAMPAASDRCWRQWERIMGLPRGLAAPAHLPEPSPGDYWRRAA